MEKVILLRYGELHLKGRNRPVFERALLKSIKDALHGFKNVEIEKINGRIFVRTDKSNLSAAGEQLCVDDETKDFKAIMHRLTKVFGLVSLSLAYKTDKSLESIKKCSEYILNEFLAENPSCSSFKVQTKRADKSYHLDSMELNAVVGEHILKNIPKLVVDVHNPGVTLFLEVREHAYLYDNITAAAGGMPSGTNGRAALLLSGGIDSPVAGYMVAKRGVQITAVHFYSFPYTSELSKQKVVDLCKVLSQYCGTIKLYIVPFTKIQQEIFDKSPQSYSTIVMRCFMMEIAELIAKKEEAKAIVTGECIGQVASQTIDSLFVTDASVSLPVFRPLIGMDKVEIMQRARDIGTYDISILPYEDCCTVFVTKNPAINPTLEKARAALSLRDKEDLIDEALMSAEILFVDENHC